MKNFWRYSMLFLFTLISVLPLYNQDLPAQIMHGFQTGNPDELSVNFNERLQLTILSAEYSVSKIQATEIIRDFFKNNPPVSFSIIHKGDKKDSNFAVGKLVTKTNTYRVNIFFRKIKDKNLIHLLEIEKENATAF